MRRVSRAWSGGLTRIAFAAAGRERALSILALHRVYTARDELFPHEMDDRQFTDLVGHLARNHPVLPLGEAFEALRRGSLPPRAVAITFDDGYADNATVAAPILRRHGMVATFFVSTGFLDGGLMWNDEVIECIRRCTATEIDLGSLGLGRFDLDTPERRRQAVEAVLPRVKYQDLEARRELLARLREVCRPGPLPTDLMMTTAQVRSLVAAGMEVGAHTVRHPILACIEPARAREEIGRSREVLSALCGTAVDVFAYPNGVPGTDYRAEHVAMVRECGFRCAVTTAAGIARATDDPHQLPRYTPWDRALWRWSLRLLAARRIPTAALQPRVG